MLGTPVSGWSHITIGDFEGSASYLTDVANDCLTWRQLEGRPLFIH